MDYNTQRKHLILPEYGRNIQNMVNHIMTIEDRDERNRLAKAIISIMGNLNPHLRDINDFKHKLWDHLAIMSNFKLDIDFPYDIPEKETFEKKPEQVPYNLNNIRFKHYGHSIKLMINEAIEMDDPKLRETLTLLIANHMKKSFLTWNKDSVGDDVIFKDLNILSQGKLQLPEGVALSEQKDLFGKGASAARKKKTARVRNHK